MNDLKTLLAQQLEEFPMAKENYASFDTILTKKISFDGYDMIVQHNPKRIISTGAKMDANTLEHRKCFLCQSNMPSGQKGIPFEQDYTIYVNPYPIFKEHFTVPSIDHIPQSIEGRLEDMLLLAKEYQDYTVFYNGPLSGASAPDHFHFQMAIRHAMPSEEDFEDKSLMENIISTNNCNITTIRSYLRNVIIFKSTDIKLLSRLFHAFYKTFKAIAPKFEDPENATNTIDEPLLNIMVWYDKDNWTLSVFPRKSRRPKEFFMEGDDKILFSPGLVDMAGLIVAPRKEDYDRYDAETLKSLFAQITVNDNILNRLVKPEIYVYAI